MKLIALLMMYVLSAGVPTTTVTQPSQQEDVTACVISQSVCVDANAPGVTADTSQAIGQLLNEDDRIVIVMLPAGYLQSSDKDITGLARDIDSATGGSRIIGLSVGDEILGYSSVMPPGVADDLMHRARSVSANIPETQRTFIRTVHDWIAQHPGVIPPLPQPTSEPQSTSSADDSGYLPGIFLPIGLMIMAAALLAYLVLRHRRTIRSGPYGAAPRRVRDLLSDIATQARQVNDRSFRSQIEEACRLTATYFAHNTHRLTRKGDTQLFGDNLETIRKIIAGYVKIQDDRTTYESFDPDTLMREAKDAVNTYLELVRTNIRNGTMVDVDALRFLTDYMRAQGNQP